MSGPELLDDLAVMASVGAGVCELAGDRTSRDAIEAEIELWEARDGMEPGGMVWAAGGDLRELRRRLSVMVRRPELTDRQRAIVSILQGRAARMDREART